MQCSKALFLYRYYPQYRDPLPPSRQAALNRGHDVGVLARQLYPGGTDATLGSGPRSAEAVERTKQLITSGAEVIYEAAFVYQDVLVLADILVRNGEAWEVYEVKSSLRTSLSNQQDAALQYYVIAGTGLAVSELALIHINGSYVRNGVLNIQQLFKKSSVLAYAQSQFSNIAARIEEQKQWLNAPQIPEVKVGARCFIPYSCDYMGHCWKHLPQPSVFDLAGMSRADQEVLYAGGIHTPEQVPVSDEMPPLARLQIATRKSGKPFVNREALRKYMATLSGDLDFIDIENFQPAVPRFSGTRPFMALPFAYSLHRRRQGEAEPVHLSFLAEPGEDPRTEFIVQFLAHTAGENLILAYDISAERYSLQQLALQFPEYAAEIKQRLDRLRDLMQPFAEGWYHDPAQNGSISLKNVLPALVPELSHAALVIKNGSHAMAVYDQLHLETDMFAREERKDELREYCRLDTLAMVRIFEVLEKAAM
ncbi:MAG: DUF2779 domain-containing protein [Bacteroidia bacterium]|jgi:hypothetical protein|nr:DUF2779 domain-containing protein [Bacteroidia bacterium]